MPSRSVGLALRGVTHLELLFKYYEVQKYIGRNCLPSLENSDACKKAFFDYKLQGMVD